MDSKGIWNSTPRRITSADASYTIGRPPDSTETGYATTVQRNLSIIPARITRAKTAAGPIVERREDQPINKSIRPTSSFCQKERRQTSNVHRLSSAQLSNNSESLCVTTNRRIVRPFTWRKSILKARPHKRILPNCDRPEGPSQNSISNALWTLRVQCNAIWSDERPCHVSNLDERHLPRYARCLCHCLSRRHPCLFEERGRS